MRDLVGEWFSFNAPTAAPLETNEVKASIKLKVYINGTIFGK